LQEAGGGVIVAGLLILLVPAFVLWRVSLWLKRGQAEHLLGVPGLTRQRSPVLYWVQVAVTGGIGLFFGYCALAIIISGLISN